ncbi:MAG: alpha-ketoglutaric semialdehyde dehydrogenase [Crocinitomix sp.]|jgi:alpha-ketoglutaric semialdehyde dehydrogenase
METYYGIEATTGLKIKGEFELTTSDQLDVIMGKSHAAYLAYQTIDANKKGDFLIAIAEEIEALGEELILRAMAETGLPEGRIIGERGRTMNQLRLFGGVAKKGEWVEAAIDTADPNREPFAKPDIRKQLEPLGPVIVFGASNFPLAYSAAGGDTASALAAGCAVVVKAHPAHPGTSQLIADAVYKAVARTGMPNNIYQHVHGAGFELAQGLVKHPLTKAVGFTGSFKGGKALYDIANERDEPIPVFAEMGSVNPVLFFPLALKNQAELWGNTYAGSITLGSGQFCTNPGLIIALASEDLDVFKEAMSKTLGTIASQQMLNDGISKAYNEGKSKLETDGIVEIIYAKNEDNSRLGGPCIATASGATFLQNTELQKELFGPYSLIVACKDEAEMLAVIHSLEGQLTGTMIIDKDELSNFSEHFIALKSVVGRVIFNGVPTGVEVATAMNHGGPFPATTDSRYSAVGADAIKRFARPVSYQNCPPSLLPIALQNKNAQGIYRKLNGLFTNDSIQ